MRANNDPREVIVPATPFDVAEYPVAHALTLIKVRNQLWEVTNLALALPLEKVDSMEAQAVAKQLGSLVRILARRGITPITAETDTVDVDCI